MFDLNRVNVIFSFLQTMLALINDRLTRKVFDDVMEVAWSTMWNVTDETPRNCKRFLDGHGMAYFLGCLNVSVVVSYNKMEKIFSFFFNF